MSRRAGLLAVALAAGVCGPHAVRAQNPPPTPVGVRIGVAADTIILPPDERLAIGARASPTARVVAAVTSMGVPPAVVWRSDTLAPGAAGRIGWNLCGTDGAAVPPGRYSLTVTALGPAGDTARAAVVVLLTRLPADTLPVPLPVSVSELEPETVLVGRAVPWAIFIGAGAALIPQLLGRPEMRQSRVGRAESWMVAGGVTVAGFVAFFTGRHPEFSAENARLNAELRAQRAERLAEVMTANARARLGAPYRVVREDGAP